MDRRLLVLPIAGVVVVAAVLVIVGLTGHGSGSKTRDQSNPLGVAQPRIHPTSGVRGFTYHEENVVATHAYAGRDSRVIGTITLSQRSEVFWFCARCRARGFTVTSRPDPGRPSQLRVADRHADLGSFVVGAGTYRDVRVSSAGQPWRMITARDPR